VASSACPVYPSPFEPSTVAKIRHNSVVIRRHRISLEGISRLSHLSPFTIVGDTQYEQTRIDVSGKASHNLEFVFKVCA